MSSNEEDKIAPFNEILGTAFGNVPAYSNTSDESFSIERHYLHGIFMGIKWQCVEYARRWLLLKKSCIFKSVRHAADIWTSLTHVERVTDGRHFPLIQHPNGSPTRPQIDTFLIYKRCDEQPVGHIAVICSVGENSIQIAEQNNKFHYWNEGYAREIPLIEKDGLFYLEDEDPIYGWMQIQDEHQLTTLDQIDLADIHSQYKETPPHGKIVRCQVDKPIDSTKQFWLNRNDSIENFFFEHFGENLQQSNSSSTMFPFYKINMDFLMTTAAVSNDLHQMFVQATNRVIHDEQLLTLFQIPQIFWTRIQKSWLNQQKSSIFGRFDLDFNHQQFKVLRYHTDTISSLFQIAVLQSKWAEYIELPSTFTTARRLNDVLVKIWKNRQPKTIVHILIEQSNENMLTALYLQRILTNADIQAKICSDTKQFFWKDKQIVDQDGQTVKLIWKLWSWQKIFEDHLNLDKNLDETHPTLSQICLNDDIEVIEPIWKVIPNNPSILSVLWSMFPNHPNLFECYFNSNNEFILNRDSFSSTKHDENHSIINPWIVRGHFAGLSISSTDCSIVPCCVVWEEEK